MTISASQIKFMESEVLADGNRVRVIGARVGQSENLARLDGALGMVKPDEPRVAMQIQCQHQIRLAGPGMQNNNIGARDPAGIIPTQQGDGPSRQLQAGLNDQRPGQRVVEPGCDGRPIELIRPLHVGGEAERSVIRVCESDRHRAPERKSPREAGMAVQLGVDQRVRRPASLSTSRNPET